MKNVYVLGGLRSYIGIKNGKYKHIPAEILGSQVLKKVIEQYNLKEIDCIISGNAVGGGGNISRLMMLEAGVDSITPAFTIDLQCGSALECIAVAAAKIESNMADLIVVGGFESSSTQPKRMHSTNHPDYEENQFYHVAKFIPNSHKETQMLEEAELVAKNENISKEELNYWTMLSHTRAKEARNNHKLTDITTSIYDLDKDECIREHISEKLLDRLPPSLPHEELINAGNACSLNDGAAFIVLCSENYLTRHRVKAKAKILNTNSIGGPPMESPKTAILSIKKLLEKSNLTIHDIDCLECNEAFAVIDVLFDREYPNCRDKYNRYGGALAYGHPFGASGAIIFLHLLKALEETHGQKGICSIAAAGSIGTSILIERL